MARYLEDVKQMDKYNALCKLNDLQWDIKRQPTFEEINKTIGETITRDEGLLRYCAYVQAINYMVDKKFAKAGEKFAEVAKIKGDVK